MTYAAIRLDDDELRPLIEQIEEAGDRVGLYSVGSEAFMEVVEGDEADRPSVTIAFEVGDRAYSKAVQDPEGAAFDAEFSGIATEMNLGRAAGALRNMLRGGD